MNSFQSSTCAGQEKVWANWLEHPVPASADKMQFIQGIVKTNPFRYEIPYKLRTSGLLSLLVSGFAGFAHFAGP